MKKYESKKRELAEKSSRHDITERRLYHHWSNGKPLNYKGKQHSVNKMSYGDYFLREKRKHGLGGGKEHWMKRTGDKKNVNDKGYRLTKENTKGGNYQRHYSDVYKAED